MVCLSEVLGTLALDTRRCCHNDDTEIMMTRKWVSISPEVLRVMDPLRLPVRSISFRFVIRANVARVVHDCTGYTEVRAA